MELLSLGNVVTCCAIDGVNIGNRGAETIVMVFPSGKMLGQITNLTPLNTLLEDKNFQHILIFSMAPRKPILVETHKAPRTKL